MMSSYCHLKVCWAGEGGNNSLVVPTWENWSKRSRTAALDQRNSDDGRFEEVVSICDAQTSYQKPIRLDQVSRD